MYFRMLRCAQVNFRVVNSAQVRRRIIVGKCGYASDTKEDHPHTENVTPAGDQPKMEMQPNDYRPGSDSYAYENPWPKLNSTFYNKRFSLMLFFFAEGRLDWLFQDGWRRPLAPEQGLKFVSRPSFLFFFEFPLNFREKNGRLSPTRKTMNTRIGLVFMLVRF